MVSVREIFVAVRKVGLGGGTTENRYAERNGVFLGV